MNAKKVYIIFILFLGLLGLNYSINGAQSNDTDDPDNYGILRGKIVDEETGENVSEKFFVRINDSDIKYPIQIEYIGTISDENGIFQSELEPGTYLLYFQPDSVTSKYSWDLNPINYPSEKQIVTIERGKITEVIKKARLAGKAKLTIVSKNGERIYPNEIVGENADLSVSFSADWLIDNINDTHFSSEEDDFNDGEILIYCLPPGKYNVEIDFSGLGVISKKLEDIEIKKKISNEINIVIDLNDPTGVHGEIFYDNGNPLENLKVTVWGLEGSNDHIKASIFTDKNGYYKIVGLKEGIYKMSFRKQIGERTFFYIESRVIKVKEGSLTRLDVQAKSPE